jgi:tetratricopeptide (TPR) repeat protein
MKTTFIVACILLLTPLVVRAEDTVAAARDLYTSANYEDALAVLNKLDSPGSQPSERMAINQYRAFCLLALGRMNEAERAIETVLSVDLLYRPADAAMSPRLRAAFAGVRQRMLPAIVQQEYTRAKAAFDRQEYPAAIAQFDRVLEALADPDLGVTAKTSSLNDLRTLATGFRDLSVKAIAPPPAPPVQPPAATVAAAPPPPVVRAIYTGTEGGVTAPGILRQVLPSFPRDLISRRDGVLEIVINEAGTVESAVMRTPINPRYDQMVLGTAKTWKYEPATVNGKPVKYRKLISITMKPTS